MRKLLYLLALPALLSAKVHYAKVEPYESVVIKSAVSAQVVAVNLDAEGQMIGDMEVIHLDDKIDQVELVASKESLDILNVTLKINQDMVSNLKKSFDRQEGYYKRLNKLSTASKTQKDTAFMSYVSAKNQYLSTKEKIESIKRQILDTELKISKLNDSIAKKSIQLKNRYLYKLSVRVGDYVNPSSPLATIQNQERAKLTLFLEPSELEAIESKKVFIDGKESKYKVDKVWNSADEKFISSYRVEIYIDTPSSNFSKLVKVELK